MPYEWTTHRTPPTQILTLRPHQSLSAKGFASFILTTFILILIPVLSLLGTVLLWGLLPFILAAVAGIYWALQRNHKAREIEEVFTLDHHTAHLLHRTAGGDVKEWQCNRHWTVVTKYEKDGPVPHYVTLRGMGREVEIGAFLSEEERITLYDELNRSLLR
ncbi:DUF2244 domain-containing protein [Sulfitobacter sp. M13]